MKGDAFLYWIQFLNHCISYGKNVPLSCPNRLCIGQQPLLETAEERRVSGSAHTDSTFNRCPGRAESEVHSGPRATQ